MVPEGRGEWDRRSVSAALRHHRRTCQVKSKVGDGKTDAQYDVSKFQTRRKSHPQRTNPNSLTSQRAELRPTFDRRTIVCVHACMLAPCAAALHASNQ